MWQQLKFRLTGIQPLMLSNIQKANPLLPCTKAIKEVSTKGGKTDADTIEILHLQFLASWYLNDKGQYVLPTSNIRASFKAGAKDMKKGTKFIEGFRIIDDDPVIKFAGQGKTPEELWDNGDGENVDVRMCTLSSGFGGKSKVLAARAIIREWSVEVTCAYDETKLNYDDVIKSVENGGYYKGIGTYREAYGRYKVEVIETK